MSNKQKIIRGYFFNNVEYQSIGKVGTLRVFEKDHMYEPTILLADDNDVILFRICASGGAESSCSLDVHFGEEI